MQRVAAVVRTNRSMRRDYHLSRTERSSVHQVDRSRECCTRKPSGKRLLSAAARLWVSSGGRPSQFAHSSLGVARSVRCPLVIVNDVPALVDFEHSLEFTVHYDVHGLSECRGEVNLNAQVALLYQEAERPAACVQGEVETEEGISVTEVRAHQSGKSF